MLETLRKHHYILMLFIAILVCVAFIFFGNDSSRPGQAKERPLAVMDGQEYYQADLAQIESQRPLLYRLYYNPQDMMSSFTDPLAFYLNTLGGNAQFGRGPIVQRYQRSSRDSIDLDFCLNVATLRAEAKKLGVEVEREDLAKFVQTVSGFRTENQFDPTKYEAFLNSGAFGDKLSTERLLYTSLRDVILFQRLNKLIGGTLAPSAAEINETYADNHQQTTAAYAVVEKAKQTPAAPDDAAIQKFYDEAKAKFEAAAADPEKPKADPLVQSEEKRTLRYILIDLPKAPPVVPSPQPEDTSTLPEDQKKAKEEEYKKKIEEHTAAMAARGEAMKAFEDATKKLKTKAGNISSDLVSEDRGARTFEEIVKASELESKLSEPFTAAAAPAELAADAGLLKEIFRPLAEPGTPHTTQTTNGYAIFEIVKIDAPALLPLDQVKTKIMEKLTADALTAAVKAAAETARTAILESIKAGKTFPEAATAAGLTPVEIPAYTKAKPPATVPNHEIITAAAAELNLNEVSPPATIPEGLVLVTTLKRELPKDPKMEEDKKALTTQKTGGAEGGFMPSYSPLFEAWFNSRRNDKEVVPAS